MKPINPPRSRSAWNSWTSMSQPGARTKPPPRGSSGTTRAARSLLRRRQKGSEHARIRLGDLAGHRLASGPSRTKHSFIRGENGEARHGSVIPVVSDDLGEARL